MRMIPGRVFFAVAVAALTCSWPCSSLTRNPYDVLGVHKRADITDIKKAYKNLAKQLHPDRNQNSENAQAQFIELNEAYDILSDPSRREKYDRFGIMDSSGSPRMEDPYGFQASGNPFFHFNFPFSQRSRSSSHSFTQHRITLKMFENTLMPQSHERLYLIFGYADMCLVCMQVEDIWEQAAEELRSAGCGIGTVNVNIENALSSKLRVRTLPTVAALIDGRVYHYKETSISHRQILAFARSMVPKHFVHDVADSNYEQFMASALYSNKIIVLMFGTQEQPSLQYLLAAKRFQTHASFGFVRPTSTSEELRMRYRTVLDPKSAKPLRETLLIFNEQKRKPVAQLVEKEILFEQIVSLIGQHKYLLLPRVTSQAHLDDLCPIDSRRTHKHVCVILMLAGNAAVDELHMDALRSYVESLQATDKIDLSLDSSRIHFVAMNSKRQSEFIESLISPDASHDAVDSTRARDVLFLWRLDRHVSRYAWLANGFSAFPDRLNQSLDLLGKRIDAYLNDKQNMLAKATDVKELQNEHAPGWYKRTAVRVMRMWESLMFVLERDELLPAFSVFGTLLVVFGVGYFLNYLSVLENRAENAKPKSEERVVPLEETPAFKQLVRELKAETYFGLVRLLKPGCRSLILICDNDSKDVLLQRFTKIVWPWRRNKALLFGYCMVERNLDWYRRLLSLALPEAGQLDINPRNVVGTVLALNGFRRYFNIYHARHAASMRAYLRKAARAEAAATGSFLGLNDAEESSGENDSGDEMANGGLRRCLNGSMASSLNGSRASLLLVDELLEGLPIWLDKLFDGSKSVTRYYIPDWPPIR